MRSGSGLPRAAYLSLLPVVYVRFRYHRISAFSPLPFRARLFNALPPVTAYVQSRVAM